ncbi:hypothetical protein JCM10908_002784 [Rhodotorula pacifica]|uniref:uncharacterized protein n=1 Tax=Rhodotorula pacifica TaxID=1495444 RepID=UPI003180BC1E
MLFFHVLPQLTSVSSTTYPAAYNVGPPPKPEWVKTYELAKAAGDIPDIPPSKLTNGNTVYPSGVNAQTICSWTLSGCFGPNDIHDAPDGLYGVSFDDGPLEDSPLLYRFLSDHNQTATHFFIGGNIVNNAPIFAQALASGGHIGNHGWSHQHMTTLSDRQILGELGWTSQAIFDHSGGLVPKYWRPPYGDADARVRAIAEKVFGLTLVGWNEDSDDWCLNDAGGSACGSGGPSSVAALERELLSWISGTSSPGIIGLEHELSAAAIRGFINTFPKLHEHSWDARCIPDLYGQPWYQNAPRNETPIPNGAAIGVGTQTVSSPGSSSTSSLALGTSPATTSSTLTAEHDFLPPSSSPTQQHSGTSSSNSNLVRPERSLALIFLPLLLIALV